MGRDKFYNQNNKNMKKDCPYCNGKGTIDEFFFEGQLYLNVFCYSCNGTGKIEVPDEKDDSNDEIEK